MRNRRVNRKATMLALSAGALLLYLVPAALASNIITGWVRNQSRSQPAVGDDVILFRLHPKMLEEARAKTDAQGQFALNAPDPDGPYLVRVVHQNVNYDTTVSFGDTLSIPVFDVAAEVAGVKVLVEMLRAGTQGKLLHVSDMYEVENASSPPMTQSGRHTFEVYVPPNAKLDSVLAAGPEKIVTMISPAPVSGEPGHYWVNFPLRPGATKFAFNYDLPYNGYAAFRPHHTYPLQQLVVMVPSTMQFSSLSRFQTLASGDNNYQVLGIKQLQEGDGPQFELSGMGALPHFRDSANQQARSQAAVVSDSKGPAQGGAPALTHTNAQAKSGATTEPPLWPAIGFAIFLVCAGVARRVSKMRRATVHELSSRDAVPPQGPTAGLDGLKNDLFRLEVQRLRGSISEDEYASARQALETTVKRALI